METKELLKSIATYGVLNVLSKVLNFLIFPFIISRLSVSEWGELDLVLNFSGLVTVFLTLSLESYIQRVWYTEDNRVTLMFSSWTTISLISMMLFIGVVAAIFFGALREIHGLIFLTGLVISWTVIPLQVLRMEEKLFMYSGVTLLQILAFLFGIILIDFLVGLSTFNIVACYLGSFMFIFLLLVVYFLKKYVFKVNLFLLKPALNYSLPLIPTVVSGWILKQTDRLLILKFLNIESVGIYGAAVKVSSLVLILIQSFKLAWGPIAMKKLTLKNEKNGARFVFTTSITYILVACFIITFLYFNVNWIYDILEFPVVYKSGAGLVWLLALVISIRGYSSIINLKVLIAKKTTVNLFLYTIAFIITIAISWILIPKLGVSGSVYGSLIGESFILLGFFFYNKYFVFQDRTKSGLIR